MATTASWLNPCCRPLSCKWLFTAAGGSVVNFRILTFDVFPSIFCYRDVFDIFDGKLMGRWQRKGGDWEVRGGVGVGGEVRWGKE